MKKSKFIVEQFRVITLIIPLPGVQVGQGAIGSQVELKRSDGDEAFGQSAHVCAALRDTGGRVAANSVIRLVAWIDPLVQAAVIDAQTLAGERDPADLLIG